MVHVIRKAQDIVENALEVFVAVLVVVLLFCLYGFFEALERVYYFMTGKKKPEVETGRSYRNNLF